MLKNQAKLPKRKGAKESERNRHVFISGEPLGNFMKIAGISDVGKIKNDSKNS
jgi:hypothetical protein